MRIISEQSEWDSQAHETQGLHKLNKCYADSSWGCGLGWVDPKRSVLEHSECDSRAHETQGLHQLNKCYAESRWGAAAGGGWIQEELSWNVVSAILRPTKLSCTS